MQTSAVPALSEAGGPRDRQRHDRQLIGWRGALAIVAGVLGVLAFPPFGIWPLAFLSVAGLSVAVRSCRLRSAALLGILFGLSLFLPMLHWTATYVGSAPWYILAFSQSWFTGLLAVTVVLAHRGRGVAVVSAALWVAEEAIRGRVPFGGFPWGRWAFSQAESPLRWFAPIGGAPLVSFVVALVGCLLADALSATVSHRSQGGSDSERNRLGRAVPAVPAVAIAAVLAAGALALGSLVLGAALRPDAHPREVTTIAAIQGNVPDRGLDFNADRRQVLDNHVAETLKLAAQIKAGTVARPSLVLWPENASDIDPLRNADAADQVQRAVDAVGVPVLIGALLDGPGTHVTNAGIVWQPSTASKPGPGQFYAKRHPVPFGEYIPLRSIAHAVTNKVDLVAQDMARGNSNGLLTQTPYPVGDVICFEVAYDSLVRSSVKAGAQLLVIQTNNATFGHSGETYQQLAMSQLRAVEYGRSVVQVSTSGKSAIIGPDGVIRQESGALFTSDILLQQVPLNSRATLATEIEAELEWVIVGLGVIALVASLLSGRRQDRALRRRSTSTPGRGSTEQGGTCD